MAKIPYMFSSEFLFQNNSVVLGTADKAFFVIALAFVALAILMKVGEKMAPTPIDQKYRHKAFSGFLTLGILQLFWCWLMYEHVSYFGYHIVEVLLLVISVIWGVKLAMAVIKNYRQEKGQYTKEQLKLKYLAK